MSKKGTSEKKEITVLDQNFEGEFVSESFRSRKGKNLSLWNYSYGCWKDADNMVYPIANNLDMNLKVIQADVWADIIEFTINNIDFKVAVNLSDIPPIVTRGGTDPNPPHGGDKYHRGEAKELDAKTVAILKKKQLFIPQVRVTSEGDYKGKILDVIINIENRDSEKPKYKRRLFDQGEVTKFKIIEFFGPPLDQHGTPTTYAIAVNPQYT